MIGCFAGFALDFERFALIAGSLMVALTMLLALRRVTSARSRITLMYAHLMFLFFPLTLFTTDFACGAMCMPCGGTDMLGMALLAVPTTVIFSTIAGFVIIPTYFVVTNQKYEIKDASVKKFVRAKSRKLNIKEPSIYAMDKAKPTAFSFRNHKSAIFLSIGLTEVLNKKELQAVLLHELAHIKEKSSALKVSSAVMRMFSPFSRLAGFGGAVGEEEHKADDFVLREQRTSRYLRSAKRKIGRFD